jgi:hypothetical protein
MIHFFSRCSPLTTNLSPLKAGNLVAENPEITFYHKVADLKDPPVNEWGFGMSKRGEDSIAVYGVYICVIHTYVYNTHIYMLQCIYTHTYSNIFIVPVMDLALFYFSIWEVTMRKRVLYEIFFTPLLKGR